MNWYRRLPIFALLFVLALGMALLGCGSGSAPSTAGQGDASATAIPIKKALADLVSAEALLVPYKRADLSFKMGGVVQEILVTEGQTVQAGQELVRLEMRDLRQAVIRSEAALKAVQAQLAKLVAGARSEELAAAEAAVQIAEARVKTAQAAVAIVEGNLAAAKAGLQGAQAGVKAANTGIEAAQGALAAAQASQRSAEASLNKLLAGPTERDLEIAQKGIELEKNQLWALQGQRDALGGPGGSSAARQAALAQVMAAESRVDIATLQYEELKAGPRTEDVQIARAQAAQAQAGAVSAVAQVAQAKVALEIAGAQEAQAQANVQTVEGQLAQAQAEVEAASAQSRQAQAQYALIAAAARTEDIAVAEAQVAQAEAALADARYALEDATLKAPFDGTIGALLAEAGEIVAPNTPVVRLGDVTRLHVETQDLSELDITRVQVGQQATVRVDALADEEFQAKVLRIAPAAIDRRGDKVYTVTLDLDDGSAEGLLWGMTAFVDIKVR